MNFIKIILLVSLFFSGIKLEAQLKKNGYGLIYYFHLDTSGFDEINCNTVIKNVVKTINDSLKLLVYAPNSKSNHSKQFYSFYNDSFINRISMHNAEFDLNNIKKNYFCYYCVDSLGKKINEMNKKYNYTLLKSYIILDVENFNWLFEEGSTIISFLKSIQLLTCRLNDSTIFIEKSKFDQLANNKKNFLFSIFNNTIFI